MIERILGNLSGGKVLDVATREGHFVKILMDNLKSYSEIVGIDIDEQAIQTASEKIVHEHVKFLVMDAEQLEFENESFDTVNISASLHHIANIQQVLGEMQRVLKIGGQFLILEMHRDGQTEAELTSVYLHHWIAKIDSELGYLHNRTLSRQEIVDFATRLGLREVKYYDYHDKDSDPMEQTKINQLENLIERTIQYAERTKYYKTFKERGDELRQRLYKVGAQSEPRLIIVGRKGEA